MSHGLPAARAAADANAENDAGYAYHVVTVSEAVERAVSGEWDVPEFQRQFAWQPSQVCGLGDSLWRNYPFGALLLWRNAESSDGRDRPRWWIADGQQRLTALCILSGREPVWLARRSAADRTRLRQRYDLRFDAGTHGPPEFVAARESAGADASGLIPVSRLRAIRPAG